MKQPLVSVIIPCYNYGDLLPEAIDSVLRQTYQNTEIIIINDGSTDNTDQIAKEYEANEKVKYFTQENKGIVATRNRGVSLAQGEFLIQLDADDYLDKNYIEEVVKTAKKEKSDIVYTNMKLFGKEDRIVEFADHDIETLKYQNHIHASALVGQKVFSKLEYDSYLEKYGFEDWDLFLGACLGGFSATLNSETKLNYRIHKSRSRTDKVTETKKSLEARLYIFEKYAEQYPREMLNNEVVEKLFFKIKREYEGLLSEAKKYRIQMEDSIHEIKKLNKEIQKRDDIIEDMKRSFFWKLRNAYWKFKNTVMGK